MRTKLLNTNLYEEINQFITITAQFFTKFIQHLQLANVQLQ